MTADRVDTSLTGLVFNIQRFSLDDGAGIRTTVFLKGCPLQCRWCQNPESISAQPEIGFRDGRCMGCRRCFDVCPRDAIVAGGKRRIDPNRCDGCGACVDACPTTALFAIGRRYTVAELVAEVSRDAAFFAVSGGGVTVSGGEPTMQFAFVHAFLRACKAAGLRTAIETNGLTTRERLAALVPFLDEIFFDVKLISTEEHRRFTGLPNDAILANARWLGARGAPVTFRMPVVAGMTATEANIRDTAAFLHEIGIDRIELCPYREYWTGKAAWLQPQPGLPLEMPSLSEDETRAVMAAFGRLGIIARAPEVDPAPAAV